MWRTKKRPPLPKRFDDPKLHPPSDVPITIVARDRWYGLPPRMSDVEAMKEPHKNVCFVPTESNPCNSTEDCIVEVQELQKRNAIFNNWPDIPFNFLIGGDGLIYEGRGFMMRYKNHGLPDLQTTLQIGYMGHYKDCDPPKEMVELGAQLIEYGLQRNYIDKDYTYIECPLSEYHQFPKSSQEFWESPRYKEFLNSLPDSVVAQAQRNSEQQAMKE